MTIILNIITTILGFIFGRKQAAGVAQGKAEQSNEQLSAALKEKENARKSREHTEDRVGSMAPDDVIDKLR